MAETSGVVELSDRPVMQKKTEDAIEFEIEETCRNADYNSGAMSQGAKLLLYTRSNRDFVDPKIFLKNLKNEIHLHHIFPKDWLKNNKVNIDENQLSKWMNSPANLIPLSPESNLKWKTMEPSQAIEKLSINSRKYTFIPLGSWAEIRNLLINGYVDLTEVKTGEALRLHVDSFREYKQGSNSSFKFGKLYTSFWNPYPFCRRNAD